MEPVDNFTLINSYNIEESQPRQLPKALPCNKVTPTPSVPDVSLVFDSKSKETKNYSLECESNSYPLNEDGITSAETDDPGPRRVKPMPIAPLPNETYASWRARAANAQSCVGPRLLGAASENSALSPCDNNGYGGFTDETVRETANAHVFGVHSVCHTSQPAEERNYVNTYGKTLNGDVKERVVEGSGMPHLKDIPLRFKSSTSYPLNHMNGFSNSSRGSAHHSHNYYKSPMEDRKDQCNVSSERQHSLDYSGLNKNNYGHNPSLRDGVLQSEYIEHMDQTQSPKKVADCFDRVESTVSAKGGPTKKRDPLRDLYRIVQLQNEQLRSLQAQVEKLLKKNLTESPKPVDQVNSKGRGSVVMVVDEGTQTFSNTGRVSSVGVMTSFIDTRKSCSDAAGVGCASDNISPYRCKECHCQTASSETANIDVGKKNSNRQETQCPNQDIVSCKPSRQNHDAPRSSVRNLRQMHQVIEEETESDESSNRLTVELSSKTRKFNHQGSADDVQKGSDVNTYMVQNKPSNDNMHVVRSSKSRTGGLEQMENQNSNLATTTCGRNKRNYIGGKSGKPVENLCYSGKIPINHKGLGAKGRQNDNEMTMTLNGVDLQTVTDAQLSPEPSIHVDIQDYQDFSAEVEGPSDEESYYSENEDFSSGSEKGENAEILEQQQTGHNQAGCADRNQEENLGNAKVGWTFYNNVLGQVNKLLENQEPTHLTPAIREENHQGANIPSQRTGAFPVISPGSASCLPSSKPQFLPADTDIQRVTPVPTLEVVREATLQHLRQLGIDLSNEQDKNKFSLPMPSNNMPSPVVRDFQDTRRVTFEPNSSRGRSTGERRPTETSLRIKALALKYLSDEQLASCGYLNLKDNRQPVPPPQVSEQPSNLARGVIGEMSSSADFTLYGMNGTNLSFTTLRYLQRYHLLPSNGAGPAGIWRHQEGIQQTNFMETAANPRGADLGDTRSPGHIDYTNDYMEGFRQGANMAMGVNGPGGKAHASTPASRIDHAVPAAKAIDAGKEGYFLQNRGDGAEDFNTLGNKRGYSEKKGEVKPKSKGKHRGHQVPSNKNGHDRNRYHSPCLPGKVDGEPHGRPPHCNMIKESDQNHRIHENLKSSNILDITALRQQPKLL